jgi:hypothetical protein
MNDKRLSGIAKEKGLGDLRWTRREGGLCSAERVATDKKARAEEGENWEDRLCMKVGGGPRDEGRMQGTEILFLANDGSTPETEEEDNDDNDGRQEKIGGREEGQSGASRGRVYERRFIGWN